MSIYLCIRILFIDFYVILSLLIICYTFKCSNIYVFIRSFLHTSKHLLDIYRINQCNQILGLSGMTDIELIMQLARLEEIGEMNQLGENGISSSNSNSKENLTKNEGESFHLNSSDTPLKVLEEENKGSVKGVQQEDLFASKNLITPKKIIKDNTHTEENDELKALADLEKELGLDELQLYLDSTSSTPAPSNLITPNAKNFDNKNSKSNFSMGVETGGSLGSFATPVTVIKSNQIEEDDDNLDELERYLESLSTTK